MYTLATSAPTTTGCIALASRFRCEIITAFGSPLVPLENTKYASVSLRASRTVSRSKSLFRTLSMSPCTLACPGTAPSMTCTRSGGSPNAAAARAIASAYTSGS